MSEVTEHSTPQAADDRARLTALAEYDILDTPAEQGFEDLTLLASQICNAPIALVSLIDRDRQWFKACVGFSHRETELDRSVCKFVLNEPDVIVIKDLTLDSRTDTNPLVTGEPFIRFYAGAPLRTPENVTIGSLCVIDYAPRPLGLPESQREALRALARQVTTMLELRLKCVKQAQTAEVLSENEVRLTGAIEVARLGTFDWNATTGEVALDARSREIFALPLGCPISQDDVFRRINPAEFDHVLTKATAGFKVAKRLELDYGIVWPDGTERMVRSIGDFLVKKDGTSIMRGVFQDVTDLKRAEAILATSRHRLEQQIAVQTQDIAVHEEVLRVSQARQRVVFGLTRQLMGIMELDGTLLEANPASLEAIGAELTDVVGQPFWLTPWFSGTPGMSDLVKNAIVAARSGETIRTELPLVLPSGETRIYDFGMHPVRNGEGRVIEIMPEASDITELRKAEEALRQSQKMEAVGQLTGGLAHDFNNLLAGISGSLELMQIRMQQGRLTDVDRYMTAAQGAARRAAALTHRLLAFSRRQTLDPKPTDVNRLVSGMQDLIQRTVGPGIPVEVVGASGLWPALVDPPQLENALLNLCINARDAMPDGGRITIETANKWLDERAAQKQDIPEGQYLSLCVTDTGIGMPPDVIARVFEPFFTTKPIGEGTGLGLSMIFGFAQQSGGKVRIYSEVDQGSTVCIYLPRHYGEVGDDEQAAKLVALPSTEQSATVLIVDDEPTVRMLVTDILEDLGCTVIEASDSAAGLKVLQSDVRIDLLVTDVGLPGGMNGRQMADAGQVKRPDLKVLFITGYAENAVLGNGHLAPGMSVMTKPFPMATMAARIRSLIEAGKNTRR